VRKRGKKMCSDVLKESSGIKPAKGTRWFVSISSIPPPDVIFSLRFRTDVQLIKDCTCQQMRRKTEFKGSIKYVTVKGGEKGILRGEEIGVELRGGNWMGNLQVR